MAITLVGPLTGSALATTEMPVVFYKRLWGDAWIFAPELRMVSVQADTGSQGDARAVIERRYGAIKHPWESAIAYHPPWGDAIGWWIRIGVVSPNGQVQPIFTGQVAGAAADPAAAAAHGQAGVQQWSVAGPMGILRKVHVSTSVWDVDGAAKTLGWAPDVNVRGARGATTGNRSAAKVAGTYLYGGTATWSHYDYLEYLLARFVDDSALGGPAWSIGGQVQILQNLETVVEMRPAQSAFEILQDLIPARSGIDFTVRATAGGFEVYVFPLSDQVVSFGPESLPGNPAVLNLTLGADPTIERKHLALSNEAGYKRVRVIGKRIVVCCSLWGSNTTPPSSAQADTLVGRWDTGLQAEYDAGTGTPSDPPEVHDLFRQAERYREVYQLFGAPGDWDLHGGQAAPAFDDCGQRMIGDSAEYQNRVRRTLHWTPLKESTDYTVDPEVDHNPPDKEPGQLPPAAWIASDIIRPDWYLPCEETHVSVSAPQTEWGVLLHSRPNHWIAQGVFSGQTAKPADLDYRRAVATIAFEADQRISVYAELPGAMASDGVLEVYVADAECWYLAPHTVVATDPRWSPASKLVTSGPYGRVLRNDRDKLCQVMVGLLARYYVGRVRAEITWRGLRPFGDVLGCVLQAIDDTGGRVWIGSPITSITWSVGAKGEARTTLRAGYAR